MENERVTPDEPRERDRNDGAERGKGRRRGSRRGRKLLLGCLSAGLALALTELGLRALWSDVDAYYVYWPNLQKVFEPAPGIMPGIEGTSRFMIDSLGLRGEEQSSADGFRILVIGGSTAECLFLDQDEAWPQVLQRRLNDAQSDLRVWVGNAGKSGLNTRDHVVQLPRLLAELRRTDLVVFLVGINDLFLRLQQDDGYDPDPWDDPGAVEVHERRSFTLRPLGRDDWIPAWKRLALWRLVSRVGLRILERPVVQDAAGLLYADLRRNRRSAATLRDRLPDLESALDEYACNLDTLIDCCEEYRVRALFLTQPAIWRDDLEPELAERCWFGGVGDFTSRSGCEYYTIAALARGMQRYNARLEEVCARRKVDCLDLAALVPADGSSFFDDCHFTEAGSALVGEVVARHLLGRPPFSR